MPAKKQGSTLGRSLVNAKKQKVKAMLARKNGEPVPVDSLGKQQKAEQLRGIWESNDLEDYMYNTGLAQREFTAEREITIVERGEATLMVRNRKLVPGQSDSQRPEGFWAALSKKLPIPLRPAWTRDMTTAELGAIELHHFQEWRRRLAGIEESEQVQLTPYERNLQVWRQLWRTVERSQVVLVLLDARDPLAFRSAALERYVVNQRYDPETGHAADPSEADREGLLNKRAVIVLNKADYLTSKQRFAWGRFFQREGVESVFFSAKTAAEQAKVLRQDGKEPPIPVFTEKKPPPHIKDLTHIYGREDLLGLLQALKRPTLSHLMVGVVGYPNVGKSSTINVLLNQKKVTVSATPGKTKHLQTLKLNDEIQLCDCPGLIFPSFASTREGMILDGILPLHELREYQPTIDLLCKYIPKDIFEMTYTINLDWEVDVDSSFSFPELVLAQVARSRSFMTESDKPDRQRAARMLIKDFLAGKLLYVHPPPRMTSLDAPAEPTEAGEEEEEELEDAEDDDDYVTEDEDEAEGEGAVQETVPEKSRAEEFNEENVNLEQVFKRVMSKKKATTTEDDGERVVFIESDDGIEQVATTRAPPQQTKQKHMTKRAARFVAKRENMPARTTQVAGYRAVEADPVH
eukprot:TRINITY_DN9048_c0_g1_i1.p1 TRINITY_DN9048_c0_g1~~TRINITY_DN9048_c0_g1_i1.p1  ORF type:complete len:633 (-),score=149.64 TRINITY_DN9048_c0_g1_i1:36-1934(-)